MPPTDALRTNASIDGEELPRPFGQYLLLERFARGGMGEVYLARHGMLQGLERYCVVKKLRQDMTKDREYVNRFIDEARVVVTLHHANICHVFDVGRVGDEYYLAMEYISGRDVRVMQDRARSMGRPLPPACVLHTVAEILEALDYAHRRTHPMTGEPLNLVHRDVSPQNVLVSFEGEIKLIDFGLAASRLKMERTQPNIVMGKMAYMAPEQARGDPIDNRADLFAVGVIAYELIAGERFYEGMTANDIWQIAGRGGFVPARWRDLPSELARIIGKALQPDPTMRFPTCGDFHDAISSYMHRRYPGASSRMISDLSRELFAEEISKERDMMVRLRNVNTSQFLREIEESRSITLVRSGDHQAAQNQNKQATVVKRDERPAERVADRVNDRGNDRGKNDNKKSNTIRFDDEHYEEATELVPRTLGERPERGERDDVMPTPLLRPIANRRDDRREDRRREDEEGPPVRPSMRPPDSRTDPRTEPRIEPRVEPTNPPRQPQNQLNINVGAAQQADPYARTTRDIDAVDEATAVDRFPNNAQTQNIRLKPLDGPEIGNAIMQKNNKTKIAVIAAIGTLLFALTLFAVYQMLNDESENTDPVTVGKNNPTENGDNPQNIQNGSKPANATQDGNNPVVKQMDEKKKQGLQSKMTDTESKLVAKIPKEQWPSDLLKLYQQAESARAGDAATYETAISAFTLRADDVLRSLPVAPAAVDAATLEARVVKLKGCRKPCAEKLASAYFTASDDDKKGMSQSLLECEQSCAQ